MTRSDLQACDSIPVYLSVTDMVQLPSTFLTGGLLRRLSTRLQTATPENCRMIFHNGGGDGHRSSSIRKPNRGNVDDSHQMRGFLQPQASRQRPDHGSVDYMRRNVESLKQLGCSKNVKAVKKTGQTEPCEAPGRSAAHEVIPPLSQRRSHSPAGTTGSCFPLRDYVRENAANVQQYVKSVSARPTSAKYRHKDNGRVPKYLQRRKVELADAELKRAEAKANAAQYCPPGMRRLPESDRVRILENLKEDKERLEKDIQGLPFIIHTPSQKRRELALNEEINEVERQMRQFSRASVFVAVDFTG